MSVFKQVIDSFDGSSELAQAEREALQALEVLGETKKDLFISEIMKLLIDAGTGTNKTVPISSIYRSGGFARAFSSASADDIPKVVEESIGGFIEGGSDNILKGIFDIITRTLQVFLGSSSGESMSKSDYFVYATDFFIYRVDLMAWSRSVTAVSLRKRIEQATAYAFCMSLVDVEKISWPDFVGIYSLQLQQMGNLTDEERTKLKAQMLETWNFMRGDTAKSAELATMEAAPDFGRLEAEYRIPFVDYGDEGAV